ncbi:aromatic acid/H+ symport family MFS transporter [Sinomonas sp. JGH33]|uniref:Aromatic acid/H+ symport family MFS transporter n=1 Tax=Sinomonas terricola TaxID=3110330 RepID=A0ABU5T5V1_9MICC|nr:aromatic acid/H+ symport family MFS transporter [Sinomonas sp. JGH33]MEA5455056.1 aromatic acid/H+ symport family MFS transporter [Sinomonas sp. JGH33]
MSLTASVRGNEAARTHGNGPASGPARRRTIVAIAICWGMVVFDGYDLIVYGTVQNSLIEGTGWGLNAASAGTIGSMAFVGMMIGAVFAGRLSDAWGRRRAILLCAIVFSVATVLCAVAPGAVAFGALRLVAGLGLGGLVPSANALAAELVPAHRRGAMATLMMSGVPLGGTAAAALGLGMIPAFGWRSMFWLALVALVILVPLGWRFLPETLGAVAAPERAGAQRTTAGGGFRGLFRAPFLGLSVLFAASTLFTLFAWYGLGTQLPKIMRDSGADLGPALTFTIALNIGAVAGSIATAWAGDRFGTVSTSVVAAFLAGAALISLLVVPAGSTAYVYGALVVAGVGTHGTQSLVIAAIAARYPDALRGTALGWALGVGRIGAVLAPQLSGLMLAAKSIPPAMNFVLFGGSAIISALLLIAVVALSAARRGRVAVVVP